MKRRGRGKIGIVHTSCKRCSKPLVMTNRSIYGAYVAKTIYEQICSSCITSEEHHDLLRAQAGAILENGSSQK
ncbi:DUF2688 domain-containing protein [Brevibacillus reuszeri]|uniref:DUF2688 domain-containing protein n=1 Tax=Brevibacillus reuszeri TaxID=54915 RepID=UPI000F0B1295